MGTLAPGTFRLAAPFQPAGDQPEAIAQLGEGIAGGVRHQVLLGATGTGKTFTMASVIAAAGRPTLVISPNKTLAAQLYAEFAEFFPENSVEYFVSYYDYYQPEAYLPSTDTYIEKDAAINDQIDRLRLKATSALLERRDVIIVASVSCIYGLGSPKDYREMLVKIEKGTSRPRDAFLADLVAVQYARNDVDFKRGAFRVRGDTVEIFPAYLESAYRVWLDLDEVTRIAEIHPVTGEVVREVDRLFIYPAKHFVTPRETLERAVVAIQSELKDRLEELNAQGKLVEAQRLESRTKYDCDMLLELGYCSGIENYSRHISARAAGERPSCLLDYFPEDYLLMIDESHVTVPQIGGMYEGDRSRKQTLVDYGFRLPSALDNRPLKFPEFEALAPPTVYVSATPGPYELRRTGGVFVEQIIRPTGLVDPEVSVRPTKGQVEDLILEIQARVALHERTLVTTLTKRMAEELTAFLLERDLRVRYLHSDIDTLTRIEILRDLRKGEFDVLVGINLLREGLDLPEVSLVAVLDADQEGFLRSQTSLIQVSGRAARNVNGRVIMYADQMTGSMERALAEMRRRREKQTAYNLAHRVTPTTIVKAIQEYESLTEKARSHGLSLVREGYAAYRPDGGGERLSRAEVVAQVEREMREAADRLDFETAAAFRDQLFELQGVAAATTGGDPRAGLSALGKGKKKPKPRYRRKGGSR